MAISTNSKTNLNSRNSEPKSPMTRTNSFQSPLNTNSPSELGRSNSSGYEEKENENDISSVKSSKPRAPAAVNGTNHFMLPTISAASKVNPSPRKKVLTGKKEQLRTSSDSIQMTKLDKGFQSPCDTNHLFKCCACNSNTPTFSQLSDKKPVATSISPIGSVDSDPCFPPYDPKTNYLSPRPQFLHYKPNPRLELYFQKDQSGTKNLEDMFSENSDTDISEEPDQENTHEEYENASSVEAINGSCEKECEDASSVKTVNEVVEYEVVNSEEKRVFKPRFFTRAKVFPVLLVLLIASLAVSYTHSPILNSPVYEKLRRSKFYEEGFNDFARNLKLWSVSSTSYVNGLISSFSGGDELGRSQFSNRTCVMENPLIEVKRLELYKQDDEAEHVFENGNEVENEIDSESQIIESIDSDLRNDFDLEDKSCTEAFGISFEEAASEVIKGETLLSEFDVESSTAISSFEKAYVLDISQSEALSLEQVEYITCGFESEPTTVAPTSGTPFEIGSYQEDLENDLKRSENREIPYTRTTLERDASISDHIPEYKSLNQYEALAITLLAIALLAYPVFVYLKNKRTKTGIYTAEIDRIPTNKKMKSNQSPQYYLPEIDYCPSEISSFNKGYSYIKRGLWGITNEVQNQGMKHKRVSKRESFASSTELSMSDSPSYGSFTTYERFPSKHGFGDDEVITPVRRSSRFKKIQVTCR